VFGDNAVGDNVLGDDVVGGNAVGDTVVGRTGVGDNVVGRNVVTVLHTLWRRSRFIDPFRTAHRRTDHRGTASRSS